MFQKIAFASVILALNSSAFGGSTASSGVPNPATQNCLELGGISETYSNQAGQIGICSIAGAQVDEWTLFHAVLSPSDEQQAIKAYFFNRDQPSPPGPFMAATTIDRSRGIGMPNPASVYCKYLGGTTNTVKDIRGNEMGLCKFSDNSAISEWTLFRGYKDVSNAKLTSILK